MNYVESLNLFGIDAKEIPCIVGEWEPTTSTEGAMGSLYMDEVTGDLYVCISAEPNNYIWKMIYNPDLHYTKAEVDAIIEENAADDGIYELIETITIEEAISVISRSAEPDGTPYNFKKMCFRCAIAPTSQGASINYTFNNSASLVITGNA